MKKIFITLYFLMILAMFFYAFVAVPFIEKFFEKEITEEYIDISKGTFYLIIKELQNRPHNLWQNQINKIQDHFSYPVKLRAINQINLSKTQLNDLHKNKTVVNMHEDFLYQKVFDSKYLIQIGPFESIEDDSKVNLIFWLLTAFVLFIPAILWAIFLWKDVIKINKIAHKFGEGNLKARVKVSLFSSLSMLGKTFNNMAERIEKLISSHKDLTNAVSHELRTPIARMKFVTETMESEVSPEIRENYLTGLNSDIEELETLVNELLMYARFERESIKFSLEKREIISWLKELVNSLKQKKDSSKSSLNFETEVTSLFLSFDHKHLERAINNLIQNAKRYANSKIIISLEQNSRHCFIHIDDDGSGIPKNMRDKILKPFVCLENSRNKDMAGHGLGLAIVKKVILGHLGNIEIKTSPLNGARFTLKLPIN